MRIGLLAPISLGELEWPSGSPPDLPSTTTAPIIAALVNALVSAGHAVHVITLSTTAERPLTHTDGALTASLLPARPGGRARDVYAAERRALAASLAEGRHDVLHAHWTYEYAMAALDAPTPALVTVHDDAWTVARYHRDAHRAVRLIMDRVTLLRAPVLTVTSPYLQRRLPAYARRKSVVVPNFVRARAVAMSGSRPPGGRADATTTPPGAAKPPTTVVVANGFSRRKNIEAALQAHRLLVASGRSHRLRLIGVDMGPGGPARAYAHERGLLEGVVFEGPLPYDQVMAAIGAADVLLHPAREEAFGMTVLEAMALGTPVIAGRDSGNVADLLDGGRCGVLCDVTDPVDVAASVAAVVTLPDAAMRLAQLARERVRRRYSDDAVVPQYIAAYDAALAAGSTRRP